MTHYHEVPHNFSKFKTDVKKIEEFLSRELSQLNIGRASPRVLDSITVEYYGTRVPLKNIASVSIEDSKTIRVSPWDKNQVKDVEKAIMASNLGLSTAVDEIGVRVIFPQLTSETREKLVKVLKEKLEESRITVRREREEVLKGIDKLTEDEKFKGKAELQKIIDEVNKNLEVIYLRKEKEVFG